jgi:hypothetical protein
MIELHRTKAELRAAKRALETMKSATSLPDMREAWQTFIDRLEKIWVKVERECQPVRSTFQPWQGEHKRMRDSDPLLVYLHQARHADQHSIQPGTLMARDIRVEVRLGGSATITFDERTRAITVEGDALEHAIGPPATHCSR